MAYSWNMFRKILVWAQRNERHLGALVFVFGFITDIITFVFLDISLVNLVFAAYLSLAAAAILLFHTLAKETKRPSVMRRTGIVLLPLVAQYLIGNMLSGFLIFYTKSSVLSVSWPFVVLLGLVFLGNEWFRTYKDRLIFLATLLFFTIYAYAIFALPLFVHSLGPWVFLGSTVLSTAAFSVFLYLLWKTGKERLAGSFIPIVGSCLAILIVMVTSYFTGLVPPIPLTLKEGSIYHGLSRQGDQYVLLAEQERVRWDLGPQKVRAAPGETLYAYTAVFAPVRFGTTVVHTWEHYSETSNRWVSKGAVSFPIAGGRKDGYRGYSERTNPEAGEWRVSVETPNGQVIGQIRFSVEAVAQVPPLREEVH